MLSKELKPFFPFLKLLHNKDKCSAAVPEFTPIAYLVPIYFANFVSNSLTKGP